MKRHYYAQSGTFCNAIQVHRFDTRKQRDAWVDAETSDEHYTTARRIAITAQEARSIMAGNRRQARNHKRNAAYVQNFGTTELDYQS